MRMESSLGGRRRPPGPGEGPREARGEVKGESGREPVREEGRDPKMGIGTGLMVMERGVGSWTCSSPYWGSSALLRTNHVSQIFVHFEKGSFPDVKIY